MSFPKKGKFFPKENGHGGNFGDEPENRFAEEIAGALRISLGDSRAGAKIVASSTPAPSRRRQTARAGGPVSGLKGDSCAWLP